MLLHDGSAGKQRMFEGFCWLKEGLFLVAEERERRSVSRAEPFYFRLVRTRE